MSVVAPSGSLQYADLNVRHTGDPQKTLALVKRAVRMGYDAVAINIDIGDICSAESPEEFGMEEALPPPAKKKKKQKGGNQVREKAIPDPFEIDVSLIDTSLLEQQGKSLRIFSRITLTLNDQSMVHNVFHNPQLKKFDLVAVRPGDEAILNTLTRKTDFVDLICYHADAQKISWAQKGKHMEQIRAEGVGFEVTYAPALLGRDERRLALSNGRRIIRALRNRGVVFCSGAETVLDIRAPVDAMNMLSLWGVGGADARPMISAFAQQVLRRAEARRTVKGALHATKIEQAVNGEPRAAVPSRKNAQGTLERLLTVKEFRAQVQFVPQSMTTEAEA